MFTVIMVCAQLQIRNVCWSPLQVSFIVQTRTIPPQLEHCTLQLFYHTHLFREANIVTVNCQVMLVFVIILCCGASFQVRNSTESCLLGEWDRKNCPVVEIHDHQWHCKIASGMWYWMVWARRKSLAWVCWAMPWPPMQHCGCVSARTLETCALLLSGY